MAKRFTVSTTVKLSPRELEVLRTLAKQYGVSQSGVVRMLLIQRAKELGIAVDV